MTINRKEREQLARRNDIMKAAREVFAKEGYENASMNRIAKEAEFTKRTLYQYFKDKADLYLSVLLDIYSEMNEALANEAYQSSNGYETIEKFVEQFRQYYKNHPNDFRIIYDIGKVRKLTDNQKINHFVDRDAQLTKSLAEIIQAGQKDGSITKKHSAEDLAVNLKFILTAVFDKLTVSGETYTRHIGKSREAFTNGLLEMVLEPLKE